MTINEFLSKVDFTSNQWKFLLPIVMMGIDFLTGIIYAWAFGHLKSYKMREGLMKKFAECVVLMVGFVFECAISLPHYILSLFSFYIVFMESVSICENLKKMGIPIPKFIEKAFRSIDLEKIADSVINRNEKE